MDQELKAGDNVILVKPVDNTPDAYVGDGITGVITRIDSDRTIWVKLDVEVQGLAPWNNELQIADWPPNYPASSYVRVIDLSERAAIDMTETLAGLRGGANG